MAYKPGRMARYPAFSRILLTVLFLTAILRGDQFWRQGNDQFLFRRDNYRQDSLMMIGCLDDLKQTLKYIPIQTDTMLLVANLWAEVRRTRQPTADPKALDRDVILAAQVQILTNEMTQVIITTTNVSHLSRLATALNWQDIGLFWVLGLNCIATIQRVIRC